MTKKEKQLLMIDLCGRLLYGVKLKPVGIEDTIISYATLNGISKDDNGDYHFEINDRDIDGNKLSYGSFKLGRSVISYLPCLRPLSSMTDEEKNELKEYLGAEDVDCTGFGYSEGGTLEDYISSIPYSICVYVVDWLNKKMFDYRGLIPMGLALEAPEGMYK